MVFFFFTQTNNYTVEKVIDYYRNIITWKQWKSKLFSWNIIISSVRYYRYFWLFIFTYVLYTLRFRDIFGRVTVRDLFPIVNHFFNMHTRIIHVLYTTFKLYGRKKKNIHQWLSYFIDIFQPPSMSKRRFRTFRKCSLRKSYTRVAEHDNIKLTRKKKHEHFHTK